MLQRWIAKQQMMQQLASMGGMPQAPSGIDGASQMMPGAPSIESLMASKPSLMDMMGGSQAPRPAPANLLDMMGAAKPVCSITPAHRRSHSTGGSFRALPRRLWQ